MTEREICGITLIGIAVLSLASIWYTVHTAKRQHLIIHEREFPEPDETETTIGIGA